MQLYNIIINNLRRRKSKMLFMLLGIVIGIATIVSVFNVIESMKTQMTKQVSEYGINVVITPDSGGLTFSYGGIILPEILYDVEQLTNEDVDIISQLGSKDMIRIIAPKLISVEMLEGGQKVTVIGGNLKQEFQIKPWLTIENENSEASLTEKNIEGFVPADLIRQDISVIELSEDQIIIGSALANSLKVNKGDTIKISDNQFEIKFILSESGETEDHQVLMNLKTAQTLFNKPEEITVMDLSVDYEAGSEEVLLAEIKENLPHVQVSSLRQETLKRDEMLTRLVRFGVAVSILIVFIGMLVVGITMSGSVRERTREIGIFRALGFRKSHIIKIILSESLIISFVGGVLGYISGNLIASYSGPIFIGETIQPEWRVLVLFISVGLSVAIGLISSIIPALKAAKLDPAEALRFI
ncbi:MAG: hypothetical protein CVV02_11125 [Firmicutes bacterium HGW-Firmicutes-7]|nr:MAG: hypothetical protein CVV02_11125 [Firmicutes bacterium HGW-Firmicutes-7]